MYLEVEHVFEATVEAVEAAMFHPEYHDYLLARQDVMQSVERESQEENAEQITRRVHYKPKPAFEHIGTKKVPAHWFEFIEQSTWDKAERKLVYNHVPCADNVARRFQSEGEIVLEEIAPGKTVRRARAQLTLHNLPFMLKPLGPVVEQMIAREARKLLEAEARVLEEWLYEKGDSVRPPSP